MGIQGLLPFLKKSSRPINLSEFKGKTAAIDVYGWLHKGAFSCAEKLVKGEPTDGYILYVMKQVSLLLSFNIKPILVFDGCHLPAKEVTELKRRENRARNRRKAKELLREGKIKEARECFQRCVEVTSSMAHEVIKACRARNIDTVVAPYEADAQLAFFSHCGIADIIITEDSDLVLFGCDKIIFKIDSNGGGILIEKEKLHLSMNFPRNKFDFMKFRNICILSGCDYLPSLHGIGLAKACRFFVVTSNPDVFNALCKLPSHLKMPHLEVTLDYRRGFMRAIDTLLHQLIFDPFTLTLKPLTPYSAGVSHEEMPYCGEFLGHERALQIALGNVDVQTGEVVDNYDPLNSKRPEMKSSGWQQKGNVVSNHPSIWDPNYKMMRTLSDAEQERKLNAGIVMRGKERTVEVPVLKRKRTEVKHENSGISEDDLQSLYTNKKKKSLDDDNPDVDEKLEIVEKNYRNEVFQQEKENRNASISCSDSKENEVGELPCSAEDNLDVGREIEALSTGTSSSKNELNNEDDEFALKITLKTINDQDDNDKQMLKSTSRNPFAKKATATRSENENPVKVGRFSALTKFASSQQQSTVVCSKYFKPTQNGLQITMGVNTTKKCEVDLGLTEMSAEHNNEEKGNNITSEVGIGERLPRIKSPLKPQNDLPLATERLVNRSLVTGRSQNKSSFNWGGRLSQMFSYETKEKKKTSTEENSEERFKKNASLFGSLLINYDTPPSSQKERSSLVLEDGTQGENLHIEFEMKGVKSPDSSRTEINSNNITTRLTPPDDESVGVPVCPNHSISNTPVVSERKNELNSSSRPEGKPFKKSSPLKTPRCRVSGLRRSTPSSALKQKQLNLKEMFAFKKGVVKLASSPS